MVTPKKTTKAKKKPVYVVTWDEGCGDPAKEFKTLAEVKHFIEEELFEDGMTLGDIKVYEATRVGTVDISITFDA